MLTVPASVDVEGIKTDFCDIDFTAIEPELMAEFNITHIMDMVCAFILLTLKAPITTATDDKFCNIFHKFRKK